ncbi:MAG: hypothetical protein J6T44_08260 [Prevotella sp.]|jgi:hypothetical protein|nr:hypothetical protein [Prevotella sp.]
MLFLDIITGPLDPRRVRDTLRIPKPVIRDTVSVPSDTTDTIVSTVNTVSGNQQVADVAPLPHGILIGDDFSTLLWSILVVLVALSLCFYFVKKYRRTKSS